MLLEAELEAKYGQNTRKKYHYITVTVIHGLLSTRNTSNLIQSCEGSTESSRCRVSWSIL